MGGSETGKSVEIFDLEKNTNCPMDELELTSVRYSHSLGRAV